ncbi:MAG: hypothetical protein ABI266_04065 [Ginsengibacter sp.]
MNLKKLLLDDFNMDLPISGGIGNSIDNPFLIGKTNLSYYVGTEMAVLKYLGLGRRIEWKTIQQELLTHNSRRLDKIKIETKKTTEDQVITQIENFYFDINDCLA